MTTEVAEASARPHSETAGRIGPNAILQTVAVIRARFGDAAASRVLAGTPWRLEHLPDEMVPERDVLTVVHATLRDLGYEQGHRVMDAAGARTARYLLAQRIPKAAQCIMKLVPAPIALRILLTAIQRNSWTFAGSATFVVRYGGPAVVEFHDCAMCRGLHGTASACAFYEATFRELLLALVSPRARVIETACMAADAECCRFQLWV